MTKTITFNTGRGYTKDGQIITACFTPCTEEGFSCVWFRDESRMVEGFIDTKFYDENEGLFDLEEWVMIQYDANNYSMFAMKECEEHNQRDAS